MKNYRIRQEMKFDKPESGYYTEDTKFFYHVERRFWGFWWMKEMMYNSIFSEYEDAINHIINIRKGHLMFTI